MMGVPKGTKSSDSQRKVFVRRVREIDVTVNWLEKCWWLEKDVSCPWEKLLAGSVVRGRIDFSYLPVVGTRLLSICLFVTIICLFEGLCISAT